MKQILKGVFSLNTSFCQNLYFFFYEREGSHLKGFKFQSALGGFWYISVKSFLYRKVFFIPVLAGSQISQVEGLLFSVRGSLLASVQSLLAACFQDAVMAPSTFSPCIAAPSHHVLCRRVFQL